MTQARETVSFKPGEVILYPGVPGPRERAFRVLEGLVRLEAVDEEATPSPCAWSAPGGSSARRPSSARSGATSPRR